MSNRQTQKLLYKYKVRLEKIPSLNFATIMMVGSIRQQVKFVSLVDVASVNVSMLLEVRS